MDDIAPIPRDTAGAWLYCLALGEALEHLDHLADSAPIPHGPVSDCDPQREEPQNAAMQ